MKLLFTVLVFCLIAATIVQAAIPPNCLPCLTDERIICKQPDKPNCKTYISNVPGGSTNLNDYTLWRKFSCTDLQSGYNNFCVAKMVEGEPVE